MEVSEGLNGGSGLDQLLARFELNPALCAHAIRGFARGNPDQFLTDGLNLFLHRPFSPALRRVGMTLIQDDRLPARVLQLVHQPRKISIDLIRKLMQCDPLFDLKLFNALRNPLGSITADKAAVPIAIDILDEVSHGTRLVPSMRHMLADPDPRIQSKAAIFIGRRTQNLTWAQRNLQNPDARVRANVLEVMDGLSGPDSQQLLWDSVAASDNRVAGNALLNLYKSGETAALPLIFQMAESLEYEFRSTAAWVMGATGDSRFANSLSRLLQDPETQVRNNAFGGLKRLKSSLAESRAKPELRLSLVGFRQLDNTAKLTVLVRDETGNAQTQISPVSWILSDGGRVVRDYSVEVVNSQELLSVAFLTADPSESNGSEFGVALAGIRACIPLRRLDDRWAILKLRPTGSAFDSRVEVAKGTLLHLKEVAAPPVLISSSISVRFSRSLPDIQLSLAADAQTIPGTAGDALRNCTLEVLGFHGYPGARRHLICIGSDGLEGLLTLDVPKFPNSDVAVHVIALSGGQRVEELREWAQSTGGFFAIASELAEIPQTCAILYTAMRHRYNLEWEGRPQHLTVELHAESGNATADWVTRAPDAVSTEEVAPIYQSIDPNEVQSPLTNSN